jgi:hypothetical protein
LNQLVKENSVEVSGKTHAGGRKRIDSEPELADWRIAFCKEYLSTANKVKASVVTPYAPRTIMEFLDPKQSCFDQKFSDMVDSCDKELLEAARELTFQGVREAAAQHDLSVKDKVWIGSTVMRIAKGTDWNQQRLDISMTGTLKFEAARSKLTGELVAEQRAFFEKSRTKALPSGEHDVIDVEELTQVLAE